MLQLSVDGGEGLVVDVLLQSSYLLVVPLTIWDSLHEYTG